MEISFNSRFPVRGEIILECLPWLKIPFIIFKISIRSTPIFLPCKVINSNFSTLSLSLSLSLSLFLSRSITIFYVFLLVLLLSFVKLPITHQFLCLDTGTRASVQDSIWYLIRVIWILTQTCFRFFLLFSLA